MFAEMSMNKSMRVFFCGCLWKDARGHMLGPRQDYYSAKDKCFHFTWLSVDSFFVHSTLTRGLVESVPLRRQSPAGYSSALIILHLFPRDHWCTLRSNLLISTNSAKQPRIKYYCYIMALLRHQSWIRHQFYLLNCNLLENNERASLLSTCLPSVKFETYVPVWSKGGALVIVLCLQRNGLNPQGGTVCVCGP